MPRGAIQATNARSRQVNVERHVASATAAGLRRRAMTATSTSACGITAPTSSGGDRRGDEHEQHADEQLDERLLELERERDVDASRGDGLIAEAIPMSVAATKPASSRMRSAATTAATTTISVARTTTVGASPLDLAEQGATAERAPTRRPARRRRC